jgi:acetyl-CoA carboxylase carboxyltransferase component
MSGPGWGADYIAALPSARIAFMGPEAGINLVYAKKLAQIEDEGEREATLAQLNAEWGERAEPWEAAEVGSIDDVIEPREARATLIRALRSVGRP